MVFIRFQDDDEEDDSDGVDDEATLLIMLDLNDTLKTLREYVVSPDCLKDLLMDGIATLRSSKGNANEQSASRVEFESEEKRQSAGRPQAVAWRDLRDRVLKWGRRVDESLEIIKKRLNEDDASSSSSHRDDLPPSSSVLSSAAASSTPEQSGIDSLIAKPLSANLKLYDELGPSASQALIGNVERKRRFVSFSKNARKSETWHCDDEEDAIEDETNERDNDDEDIRPNKENTVRDDGVHANPQHRSTDSDKKVTPPKGILKKDLKVQWLTESIRRSADDDDDSVFVRDEVHEERDEKRFVLVNQRERPNSSSEGDSEGDDCESVSDLIDLDNLEKLETINETDLNDICVEPTQPFHTADIVLEEIICPVDLRENGDAVEVNPSCITDLYAELEAEAESTPDAAEETTCESFRREDKSPPFKQRPSQLLAKCAGWNKNPRPILKAQEKASYSPTSDSGRRKSQPTPNYHSADARPSSSRNSSLHFSQPITSPYDVFESDDDDDDDGDDDDDYVAAEKEEEEEDDDEAVSSDDNESDVDMDDSVTAQHRSKRDSEIINLDREDADRLIDLDDDFDTEYNISLLQQRSPSDQPEMASPPVCTFSKQASLSQSQLSFADKKLSYSPAKKTRSGRGDVRKPQPDEAKPNVIQSPRSSQRYTPLEDETLERAIAKIGHRWVEIRRQYQSVFEKNNRSTTSLALRWKLLCQKGVNNVSSKKSTEKSLSCGQQASIDRYLVKDLLKDAGENLRENAGRNVQNNVGKDSWEDTRKDSGKYPDRLSSTHSKGIDAVVDDGERTPMIKTSKLKYSKAVGNLRHPPKKTKARSQLNWWTVEEERALVSVVENHRQTTNSKKIPWSVIYKQHQRSFSDRNPQSMKLHWLCMKRRII